MFRKAKAASKKAIAVSKKAGAESSKTQAETFSKELVVKDIMKQARALNISQAAVEKYVDRVAEKVNGWVAARGKVTEDDINSIIAKEIKKYNRDIAFIYENRGKII